MPEEEKNKGKGNPPGTSPEKEPTGFVELKGERFKEDPKNLGQPLLDENGDPVPYKKKVKKRDAIDYKAELENAQEKLDERNKSLKKAGKKIRKLEEVNEKTMTADEIREMIREETDRVYSKVSSARAKDFAYQLADSPDEAKLILFHYKNSVLKSGDLEEDMRKAYAVANSSKLSKRVEEAERMVHSQKFKGKSSGAGAKKTPEDRKKKERPALTAAEERLVKEANLQWDAKIGKWRGKRSGKVYDNVPRGEGPAHLEGPTSGKTRR